MDNNFTDFTKNDTFDTWTPEEAGAVTSRAAHHKRPRYDTYYGEPAAKRTAPSIVVGGGFKWNLQALAAAADSVASGGKSPVSALNELGVRVAYSVLRQAGPAHCPSFTVRVRVADLTFCGCGHSKREARAAAARACLAALLARAGRALPPAPAAQDFTSDDPAPPAASQLECLEAGVQAPTSPMQVTPPPELSNGSSKEPAAPGAAGSLFGAAAAAAHKSPINVLYENYSGLVFSCSFGDGSPLTAAQAPLQLSHSMRFKVVCQIKDQKFEGYGSSKKLAKLAAARCALAALEERAPPPAAPAPHPHLRQHLADHIAKLVNEKFNELMKNDVVHSKRKVLAGIVITTHGRLEDARVIAVTTGTKCVSGEHMSVTGRALNDCHAEVAARRCLQRHLYAQLLQYAQQPDPAAPLDHNDLEPLPGGGYRLKPSRAVHLYVSTAPCGDGRIFSPHEHHHAEPDKHPNRLARGQLRTKIESGEGTIPVKNCTNVVQTWDGVMQGERLLTMSCSDKVARWCVCGLQGALLSRLLLPVYLQSLVLGSLLHPHHMYRAICGRIEAYISSLPPPFHLQRPLLSRAASTEARTPARAPSFSVVWCSTQQLPEVINATTGKLESGQPSLLCKQSMFARWHYLVKRLPLLPQETDPEVVVPAMPDNPDTLLYNEAKQMCPTYQLAKQRLIEAFEKAKLGRWIKRPLEQDQFVCEVAGAAPELLFAWAGRHPLACDVTRHQAAGTSRTHQPDCDCVECKGSDGILGVGHVSTDRERDKLSELRLPLSLARPAAGPRHSHCGSEDAAHDASGLIGSRSLSYYQYRSSKAGRDNLSHSDKIILPKMNRSSISNRLVNFASDDEVSHRSVVDYNNVRCSFEVNVKRNDHDAFGNDDWDDDENDYDSPNKVTRSGQLSDHTDVTLLAHKISDVTIGDDKKIFWSEFYKSRQAKRTLPQPDTKDSDVTERTLYSYNYDKEAQFADSSRSVSGRAGERERGPLVDKLQNICLDKSSDAIANCSAGALRKPRSVRDDDDPVRDIEKENTVSNANRKDKLMIKLAAYYSSRFRDEPVTAHAQRGHCPVVHVPTEADTNDFFFNNKVSAEPAPAQRGAPSVKNSLLLRRLHIYEQISTKKK